jgi:hypothetical protein
LDVWIRSADWRHEEDGLGKLINTWGGKNRSLILSIGKGHPIAPRSSRYASAGRMGDVKHYKRLRG